MVYEYSGYLRTILGKPDEAARDRLNSVIISAKDLASWTTKDLDSEREWQKVPVYRTETQDGVQLVGKFDDVVRMDTLGVDDPRYWVALSSLDGKNTPFPVDVREYPIAEITYRCTSQNARPAWVWTYPGGQSAEFLPTIGSWRTLARRIPQFGFPGRVDALILRVYATTRTTESVEVQEVRFRQMTAVEAEACKADWTRIREECSPPRYSVLDEFLPLGVVMNAETARRLAEMMGISQAEYWDLAFEDIVTHRHNCVALENAGQLTQPEWDELLRCAGMHGVRIIATHDLPLGANSEAMQRVLTTRIRPYVDSPTILAWGLERQPREEEFPDLLQAKAAIEDVDANHPVVAVSPDSGMFSLFAPVFAASGLSHFASHAPWETGEIIQTHLSLAAGQQVWVVGPGFTYATGTPEWSTCPEVRLMVNLSFATGARGWFSYAYHNDPVWVDGRCQRTLTGPFLNFSDLWLELDRRMERLNALAPLLLQAEPARLPRRWYVSGDVSRDRTQIPEGVPPTSSYRLRGPGFNLFFVVSNDMRGMSALNIDIPQRLLRGQEIYVLSDFVQDRVWEPMSLHRHLEMFPGQSHVVLVAEPAVCTRWRDVITKRLIEDDRRQIHYTMAAARAYDLNISAVEKAVESAGHGTPVENLTTMDRAKDSLVDLIYDSPAIYSSRSALTRASSAVCACDGALCRLINRGKVDLARGLGLRVVPLAREAMHLRIEIRQGRGEAVLSQCEDLGNRALKLLEEIRAQYGG